MKIMELMYNLSYGLMTQGCQHNITILMEDEDYKNLIVTEFGALKGFDPDKFTFYNIRGVDIDIIRKK